MSAEDPPLVFGPPTTTLSTLPSSRFTPEWWWVFTYGISVVFIIVFNSLTLISICKNSFLHTNTNRAFSLLALRNVLRAMYGLVVLYTTRWRHMEGWKKEDNHQTKVNQKISLLKTPVTLFSISYSSIVSAAFT